MITVRLERLQSDAQPWGLGFARATGVEGVVFRGCDYGSVASDCAELAPCLGTRLQSIDGWAVGSVEGAEQAFELAGNTIVLCFSPAFGLASTPSQQQPTHSIVGGFVRVSVRKGR